MNWKDIITKAELVYASTLEDKGFQTWSLKNTTCSVSFYELFPLDDIDRIICNILETHGGYIAEETIATIPIPQLNVLSISSLSTFPVSFNQ